MKNSLKQMLRTPLRTGLLLVLIVFAALLMTLGACIWLKSYRTMEAYENRFTTIGTVRQIPRTFEQALNWDAEEKGYRVQKKGQYSSYYTVEDLAFPGMEYLAGPEQRAYYASYTPEYMKLSKSLDPYRENTSILAVEFSPMEDCIPNESVQIQITKVIGGNPELEGALVWFCDHCNPEPEMLYQNKTYAAILTDDRRMHGKALEEIMAEGTMEVRVGLEYSPESLSSEVYLSDGSIVEDAFRNGQQIYEVIDGFYETDAGKRILNISETIKYGSYIQPVTGTNKTCLLLPFYNGSSYICEGRDISKEEYAEGSKVCLAPKTFMENNGLSLGDKVRTHFLYTDTHLNAGRFFWLEGGFAVYGSLIDSEGNPLEPFETSEYVVVGIYDTTMIDADYIFNSGSDELIVPMNSIEERAGRNLLACGPMTDATTSFQIQNGTIEEFLMGWSEYGIDDLEFTFYDRGYSKLKAGIDNMKRTSFLLLIVGVLLTGMLLFFFSHLFITKQAARTAIERSLGMTCAQCRWSILSGFLLLILAGSIIGSIGGIKISDSISAQSAGQVYYDSTYTAGNVNAVNEVVVEEVSTEGMGWIVLCCSGIITVAGMGIALWKMHRSLKREPMQLLAERQEE